MQNSHPVIVRPLEFHFRGGHINYRKGKTPLPGKSVRKLSFSSIYQKGRMYESLNLNDKSNGRIGFPCLIPFEHRCKTFQLYLIHYRRDEERDVICIFKEKIICTLRHQHFITTNENLGFKAKLSFWKTAFDVTCSAFEHTCRWKEKMINRNIDWKKERKIEREIDRKRWSSLAFLFLDCGTKTSIVV